LSRKKKEKKGVVNKMNERIEKELNALANKLSISAEDMKEKYDEIAQSNGLDLENDRQSMVALTLTRNFVRGSLKSNRTTSTGGFGNTGFGFLVGLEPARDVQEWRRKQIVNDYNSNPNDVYNEGRIAEVTLTADGA
jgi:hypothetical protein